MAKRKKTKKVSSRRRRVGAASSNDLVMTLVGGVAGAIGGKLLSNFAAKTFPTLNANVLKYGTIGIEAFGGYMLAKKGKPGLVKGLGMGLAISGGLKAAGVLLPTAGIGRTPVLIPSRAGNMVGGVFDVPRLGAVTPNGGFPRPATVGYIKNKTAMYAGGSM